MVIFYDIKDAKYGQDSFRWNESVARKCICVYLHLESIDRGRIKGTFKEAVDT